MTLIWSPRFADHKPPIGHPESPARAQVMADAVNRWRATGGEVVAPRSASSEQLLRVHEEAHIHAVIGATGRAVSFDQDTFTGAESVGAALLAAGAGVDLAEHVLGGQHPRAFALVRPPGHHAERGRAMGFCLFNNVAIAAAHARAMGARVAIVDYDVTTATARSTCSRTIRRCCTSRRISFRIIPAPAPQMNGVWGEARVSQ